MIDYDSWTDTRGLKEVSTNSFANKGGLGWTNTIARAERDVLSAQKIMQNGQPGKTLHVDIFGFSRGAAMSNELARKLKDHHIEVRFLGMFDPVYSYGWTAGQGSWYTDFSWAGLSGNYVTTSIPTNVKDATVYYAANETRSWFPATKMTVDKSTTKATFVIAPGGHGEIGGHWQNGEFMQQFPLHGMYVYAQKAGVTFRDFTATAVIDPDIEASLNSRYLTKMTEQLYPHESNDLNSQFHMFELDKQSARWTLLTEAQYKANITNTDLNVWKAGIRTGQWASGLNFAATKFTPTPLLLFNLSDWFTPQPLADSYTRDFNWEGYTLLDLADLYPETSDAQVKEVAQWKLLDEWGTGGCTWEYYVRAKQEGRGTNGWQFSMPAFGQHGPERK